MKKTKLWARILALVVGAIVAALPALAAAQEFVKVEGPPRQEMPAGPFVAAAYGFIWIAILAYVVVVARGLGRVRQDLRDLRAKIDRASDRASRP
jgi:CcmD family protein